MSEERLEQEELEDEDVEAHSGGTGRDPMLLSGGTGRDPLANDDDSDDVEAHRRRTL